MEKVEGKGVLCRGTIVPTGMNASEYYQPDALVSFEYEGIYLAFANIISFNTTTAEQHQQGGGDNPGGTVTSELVFSTDHRRGCARSGGSDATVQPKALRAAAGNQLHGRRHPRGRGGGLGGGVL